MNPLVTPSWLAGRLGDPGTAILDATLPPVGVTPPVDTHLLYLAGHIPGAIFFDIEALSDHSTPLPHMLPTAEAFSRDMSALGVDDRMTICIYEQESVFSAPRAWWMIRTFGAREVYILDGGLRAWKEAGFPTSSGPVRRAAANFHAKLDRDALKNFNQMQQMIAERGQILDARSTGRFTGASPKPPARHQPGPYARSYQHPVRRTGRGWPSEARRTTPSDIHCQGCGHETADHDDLRLWRHCCCHRPRPRNRGRQSRQPVRWFLGRIRPTPRSRDREDRLEKATTGLTEEVHEFLTNFCRK